jgi:hypothetical protein
MEVRTNVFHVQTELTTGLLSRSFLLFIPATKTNLRAVLSYYSATATVNQEGDVHINDTMQGLGMRSHPDPQPPYPSQLPVNHGFPALARDCLRVLGDRYTLSSLSPDHTPEELEPIVGTIRYESFISHGC